MDASPYTKWLSERLEAVGYVVIFVSYLFVGSGRDAVICFSVPAQTWEGEYSVGVSVLCRRRRKKWKLAQITRK